jgi:choline dehydrogenase-like flavoprotein
MASLSAEAQKILLDLAVTALPPGRRTAAPSVATIDRLDEFLAQRPPAWSRTIETLARVFENAARLRFRRAFTDLPPEKQLAYLHGLYDGSFPERAMLRVLLTPLKVAHYDNPELFAAANCVYRADPVVESAPPRYLERATDAATLGADELIEAEVVVVGSGAGGAVVAAELAQLGVAVVIVEEGGYHRRKDFTGRPLEMITAMYRGEGTTCTVGNCFIAVPMGRCVGGTTTINSGTCYRTPDRVLRRWVAEGLTDLAPEAMEPHFAKVEQVLQCAPADLRHVGPIAEIVARGCKALGFTRHGPLTRNAPDCDGKSLCCFGCPTDAKRSTNISYVPLALRSGASLIYGARVEHLVVEGGHARGVVAVSATGQRLTVRARAVVLAAGTLMTPTLLMRQGLANASGQLGRNLSVHPALGVIGLFPDVVRGSSSIPQGYCIEDLHDEGIMFEGAFVPLDFGAGGVTFFGQRYTELMEAYEHIGYMGFMIEDTSRGRVRLGPGGRPLMTYVMNDHDVSTIKRGVEILARIYLAAGAEAVFPLVKGFTEMRDLRDLERLRVARLTARDFELTAHHPLGTARMGVDPRRSVVGPTHEAHDLARLFICDGSSVPSCLGVNPQVTIMALATRAAPFIARAVEG